MAEILLYRIDDEYIAVCNGCLHLAPSHIDTQNPMELEHAAQFEVCGALFTGEQYV